jgi:hypothetical protein
VVTCGREVTEQIETLKTEAGLAITNTGAKGKIQAFNRLAGESEKASSRKPPADFANTNQTEDWIYAASGETFQRESGIKLERNQIRSQGCCVLEFVDRSKS